MSAKNFKTYSQVYKAVILVKENCFAKKSMTDQSIFLKTGVGALLRKMIDNGIIERLPNDKWFWRTQGMSVKEVIEKVWGKFKSGHGPETFEADNPPKQPAADPDEQIVQIKKDELEKTAQQRYRDQLTTVIIEALAAARDFKIQEVPQYIAFRIIQAHL